jgi:hypothetical protein
VRRRLEGSSKGGLLVGSETERLVCQRRRRGQDPAGLDGEVVVAWEDPRAVLPGLDRISGQPPPHRRARDRSDDALLDGGAGQIGHCHRDSGRPELAGSSHASALIATTTSGGLSRGDVRPSADHPARPDASRRTVCATWTPPAVGCRAGQRYGRCVAPRQPSTRSWPARPAHTMTYTGGHVPPARARSWPDSTIWYGLVRGINVYGQHCCTSQHQGAALSWSCQTHAGGPRLNSRADNPARATTPRATQSRPGRDQPR